MRSLQLLANVVLGLSIFCTQAYASTMGDLTQFDLKESKIVRITATDKNNELKCLTDVSDQAHSKRDVAWQRCANNKYESDYDLQVWTITNANSIRFDLNSLTISRRVSATESKYLQIKLSEPAVKTRYISANVQRLEVVSLLDYWGLRGRMSRFDHFDHVVNSEAPITTVNTIQRLDYATGKQKLLCLAHVSNTHTDDGAILFEVPSKYPFMAKSKVTFATQEEFIAQNCADVSLEVLANDDSFDMLFLDISEEVF